MSVKNMNKRVYRHINNSIMMLSAREHPHLPYAHVTSGTEGGTAGLI